MAVKPEMVPPRACILSASLEQGDMLVVLPDNSLVVTDVSVVQPAPDSFVWLIRILLLPAGST
jgi:hypothetical protein